MNTYLVMLLFLLTYKHKKGKQSWGKKHDLCYGCDDYDPR